MYERLIGARVCLRKAREDDWRSMLENVWGDEEVYRFMLFAPTHTEEDARDRCERSIVFQKDHLAWFIALEETDEAIGLCAIRDTGEGHFEENGICLGQKHQDRGYGKEVVSLLLELAFEKLDAKDFRYGYYRENERSKRLAEGFGFEYDRSYEKVRPWDGAQKTIDSCILTRDKYLALKKGRKEEGRA